MDLERTLLSKLVFVGKVEMAISRSIEPNHFVDDECRDMYRYLVAHATKYKSSPSLDAVKHDRPDFEWIQTQESIEWLLDKFIILVKRRMADEMMLELAHAADDPERSENIDIEFLEISHSLVTALPTGAISRFSEMDQRIKEYEERRVKGKPSGIPYSFPTLDKALGGVMEWELVTVLGWTNVGKSTLLRIFAFNFWMNGYTPLYFSLEMGADEILRDIDAMAAHLSHDKLKQLDLSKEEMRNWRNYAREVKSRKCDIPIIDPMHKITPHQVYAGILRHKPDVAIVDYLGLMKSSQITRGIQKHQQISDIIQDLKMIARMLRIPIIVAAQTNRGGAKDGADLDNVAESVSISQTSDTVIGLFQDEGLEKRKEMEIRINKSRRGPRPSLKAIWDFDKQEFREKTFKDMFTKDGR